MANFNFDQYTKKKERFDFEQFTPTINLQPLDIGDPSEAPIEIPDRPEKIKTPVSNKKGMGGIETLKSELAMSALPMALEKVPLAGALVGIYNRGKYEEAKRRLDEGFDYGRPIGLKNPRDEKMLGREIDPTDPYALNIYTTKEKDQKIVDIFEKAKQSEKTTSGAIASGLINLLPYMGEFAATSGISATGRSVGRRTGMKLFGNRTVARLLGWIGGATARGGAGFAPRGLERTVERQYTEDEPLGESVAKAWSEQIIQAGAETSGETIAKGLAKLPFAKQFVPKLQKAWSKITGGSAGQFVDKLLTKGGYSNLVGEIGGEERLETILRAIANTNDFGAGKDSTIGERIWAGLKQDWEGMPVELAVLSAPAAVRAGAGMFSAEITSSKAEKAPRSPVAAPKPIKPTTTTPPGEMEAQNAQSIVKSTPDHADVVKPEGAKVAPSPQDQAGLPERGKGVPGGRQEGREVPGSTEKQVWEMTLPEYGDLMIPDKSTYETTKDWDKAVQVFADKHESEVKKALSENKPVPLEVLQEYKGEPWADEAIAKATQTKPIKETPKGKPKEPIGLKGKMPTSLMGGVPKEPPGLTKAEVEPLGRSEQRALRSGQKMGAKIGYKLGQRDALESARRTLDTIRIKGLMEEKSRQDAAEIVRRYVPKKYQYRYTKRILKAKDAKRIERLTEAINKYLDKADQAQARSDFRKFISQTRKKYKNGKEQFGKLRSDVRDKLMSVLEDYDLSKLSERKREVLERRQQYINRVAGSVADAFESLEGKDILQMPNARIEELNRLRKTHIGQLDADQIRYIHSSLDHLIKMAEKKGSSKEQIRAEKVSKLVVGARQEVSQKSKEHGTIITRHGPIAFMKHSLSIAQATPRTLVQFITDTKNDNTVELVTKNLKNMMREKHRLVKEMIVSLRQMLKNNGITKKDTDRLSEITTIKYGGKTFKVDIGTVLSVYMDTQAEGNLQAILKTGRVFTLYDKDKLGSIKQSREIHTRRPTLEELRSIVDFIEKDNPKLKILADTIFEHNEKIQSPIVNKASMEFQNYDLARQKKYWHMSRVLPLGMEGKKTDISVSVENQGRYLPRTGGKQPLRVIPFQMEVISQIQSNAAFASMTMPMQDIKALISDNVWQKRVIKNGRGKELKALITMLRRIQGQITDRDFIDIAGSKILNNFGKSVLSLRLSGYGVQTASIPAAFETIDSKYFIHPKDIAKLAIIPNKTIKEMMDLSPTLWMRWTARQFDFVIGGAAAQDSLNTLLWDQSALTEKMLGQYTAGDKKAIYHLYEFAKNQIEANTDFKRGTDEFKKAAIELVEKALDTQPQWDLVYRNILTSSPYIILRGSLMFSSARNAQYNVVMRAISDYAKGRIGATEAGRRVSGVMFANILVALVKKLIKHGITLATMGLISSLGDDEKKEKAKRAAKAKINQLPQQLATDTALNLISLPAFGGMAQNIAYETIKRIKYPNMQHDLKDVRTGNIFADLSLDVTSVVSETAVMSKYIITGEKFKSGPDEGKPKWKRSAMEVSDGMAELIAMRYGLPYSAPKEEIYYQVKSGEKAIDKTMSNKELEIAIQKCKKEDGGIKKNYRERYNKLMSELARRQ